MRERKPIESLPGLTGAIAALERDLGSSGRVLVRYSGTEPKLRLLVEGPTSAIVRSGIDRLSAAARAELDHRSSATDVGEGERAQAHDDATRCLSQSEARGGLGLQ